MRCMAFPFRPRKSVCKSNDGCSAMVLSKKSLDETAVDGDDVAGGSRASFARQPDDRRGANFRSDGAFAEGPLGVEIGEFVAQRFGGVGFGEGNFVFLERLNDAVARKHGGPGDNGRRSNSVDANVGPNLIGEFANEVTQRGFAGVVGFAAILRDDRVCRTCKHDGGGQVLIAKKPIRSRGQEDNCRSR